MFSLLVLLIFVLSLVYLQYSGARALPARENENVTGNHVPSENKSSTPVSPVALEIKKPGNNKIPSSNQGPSSWHDIAEEEDSAHENDTKIPAESITIAIFCALAYEAVAVRYMLDKEYSCRLERGGPTKYVYSFGLIGEHNVVIARPPDMGTVNAAHCAAAVSQQFPNVRLALMVGIGAGLPSPKHDVRLGDLVVSSPRDGLPGVVQYDFVKREQEKDVQKGCLNKPPRILISADGKLQEDEMMEKHSLRRALRKLTNRPMFKRPVAEDILFDENFLHVVKGSSCSECNDSSAKMAVHRPQRPDDNPIVHRGLILSGDGVIKSSEYRKRLQQDYPEALCLEMEAAGIMDELPCLVVRGICDYADTHKNDEWHYYAAAVAAAYCKALLRKVDAQEVQEATTMKQLMDGVKGLAEGINKIQDSQRDTQILVQNIDRRMLLETLRPVEEALFDAYQKEGGGECLQGTRTELLAEILKWGSSLSGPCIFCLEGMAGTGKSTISRTTAALFRDRGIFAASFFFKRNAGDQGNARRLFSTIAWQITSTIPGLSARIQQSADKERSISTKTIDQQFDQLLLQPLRTFGQSNHEKPCFVIVIDALDECEAEGDIENILRLLPKVMEVHSITLRFFLTCRPEHAALRGFKSLKENDRQYLILQTIPKPIITRDISLFLEHRFSELRKKQPTLPKGWPGKDRLQTLVTIAIPLFIFAATVCRFLEDPQWQPEERLVEFLDDPATRSASEMERTYLPILNQLLKGRNKADSDKLKQEFHEIIGVIVLLARPLSVESLTTLLSKSKSTVKGRVESFRSVLSVPEDDVIPVTTLHLSFRDFLVSPECEFRINEAEIHGNIASHCLRIMNHSLRHNICSLPSYGIERAEIHDSVIKQHLPDDLRYACRYWAHHLHQSKEDGKQMEALSFLKVHFLHWLEVMSLIGLASEGVSAINALHLKYETSLDENSSEFLHDAKRFILKNSYMADLAPLQLYCAALTFAPMNSAIRAMFKTSRRWIETLPQVEESWNAELQTLEGHSGSVGSVAFSADGLTVASGSHDKTIKLWDAKTGSEIRTLEGHLDWVGSVAFSADGLTVVSGSYDKMIKLWDAKTGSEIRTLEGHSDSVRSVAFSVDGLTVVSGSADKMIKLWDAKTGLEIHTLEGHSGSVESVVFSADSLTVVSGSADKIIKLWDAKTGSEIRTLEGHLDWVGSVAFSADGLIVASGSHDKTIKLWDTKTGSEIRTLEGHSDWVGSVAFSADSLTVVSGSHDKTIKLWDAKTGSEIRTLEGHSGLIVSMAFSADGLTVASGSDDKTIKLWDAKTRTEICTLKGHLGLVGSVAFSADGLTVASGSDDKTIKLWDTKTGSEIRTLEGHSGSVGSVAFSADGLTVVSGSYDKTIKLWDTKTRSEIRTLKGHLDLVRSVVFSADGLTVASGSADKKIKLWDAKTGSEIRTLEGPFTLCWIRGFLSRRPNSGVRLT
ncbi:putative wd40 protein [Aspergillus saccharolyticus JOP 1030-1]|uniref:Putative wd40 protein n=1 Tax=Aspergillus saccharolyticus JOP 1030-1 TaxID=1450539 RepID=A0A318ZP00_9EURO|nr:putative wd40 protein [Aspergillus saccharolyticus JOP 1030-1]PYH49351.1 putative wd40 protein [Aspergillus saccharolyticus JOP 1030-1]